MESFIGGKHSGLLDKFMEKETRQLDENYVCFIAKEFSLWIEELCDYEDDWLKTCAIFITMAEDFFAFVASYRSGDSTGIRHGYQDIDGVWKALGQNHYEERH